MDKNDFANLSNQLADHLTALTGRTWTLEQRSRLEVWLSDKKNRSVGREWLAAVDKEGHVRHGGTIFALQRRIQSGLTGRSGEFGGFRPP